jgi:quercetin dioxygenase-like cupin family protein
MALAHAQPLDVIDLGPLGPRLKEARTASLLKTGEIQLMRLALREGDSVPEHGVAGAITVQCLEGAALIMTRTRSVELHAGQLVVLAGGEPHALRALADSSLLVTLLLDRK